MSKTGGQRPGRRPPNSPNQHREVKQSSGDKWANRLAALNLCAVLVVGGVGILVGERIAAQQEGLARPHAVVSTAPLTPPHPSNSGACAGTEYGSIYNSGRSDIAALGIRDRGTAGWLPVAFVDVDTGKIVVGGPVSVPAGSYRLVALQVASTGCVLNANGTGSIVLVTSDGKETPFPGKARQQPSDADDRGAFQSALIRFAAACPTGPNSCTSRLPTNQPPSGGLPQ